MLKSQLPPQPEPTEAKPIQESKPPTQLLCPMHLPPTQEMAISGLLLLVTLWSSMCMLQRQERSTTAYCCTLIHSAVELHMLGGFPNKGVITEYKESPHFDQGWLRHYYVLFRQPAAHGHT
jgi:hypothetical protein